LKLYAFYPEGHGPLSFFVMAKDEHTAKTEVCAYIEKHCKEGKITGYDFEGKYAIVKANENEVLVNNNC